MKRKGAGMVYTPSVSARHKGWLCEFKVSPVHSFKDSQVYTGRPCLRNKNRRGKNILATVAVYASDPRTQEAKGK